MKRDNTHLLLTCVLLAFFTGCSVKDDFPVLKGPYLGQEPPGRTPEIFASGIISTEGTSESCAGFGMDGKLFVFLRFQSGDPNIIHFSENKNGSWTKPLPAPFNSQYSDSDCNFAPDGRTFYFSSNRPVKEGIEAENPWNIWVTRFVDGTWASPVLLEYPINSEEQNEGYASVTEDGTLYFFSVGREDSYGQDDLYRAVLTSGEYTKVENLGGNINSEFSDCDSYIAPDESYLIFCSNRPGGYGKFDLYVSFRKEDGSWMESINLGNEINSKSRDFIPTVTPDGRFFFFKSERKGKGDIYWVSTEVIHALKSKKEKDEFPLLKGPYLGQEPPGMTPEVFASGVLNTEKMGAFCTVFSPDGNEFYFVQFSREEDTPGGPAWMRRVNNVWTKPQILPFNSDTSDNDMCLSSDGNKLIFRSWRALPNGTRPKDHSFLWICERRDSGWSPAKPLECGNAPVRTGYPSITSDGSLYFAHSRENLTGIYKSQLENNVYGVPKHVYTVLDSVYTEGDMFVAPDESYMIIACHDHPKNTGGNLNDLYIVFRNANGKWSRAINMGNGINTPAGENCPQVSPDGKYFFFNRYDPEAERGNMYWMDSKIIETLKSRITAFTID